MGKEEFLEELRRTLSQDLPESTISGQVNYYNQYITEQVRNGIPEEEVLASIGSPRLIGKTILDTTAASRENYSDGAYEKRNSSCSSQPQGGSKTDVRKLNDRTWIYIGIGVIALIAVLVFLASVISVLAPFLVPIVIVALVLGYFKRRK